MTDEQAKQLTASVEACRRESAELKQAITGDKLNGKPGLLDVIDAHRREIFGDRESQHVGLKKMQERLDGRLRSLERDRVKVIAYAVAASSVFGVLWILVKQFIFTGK